MELAQEAAALWLSPPAHPAVACLRAGRPQAIPAVPSNRLDGEVAEAPPCCRGGARTPRPAERAEPDLVDGFRLRRTQHRTAYQMPDGGR